MHTRNVQRLQKRQFKSCLQEQGANLRYLQEEAKQQRQQLNQLQAQQERAQLMIKNLQQLIQNVSQTTNSREDDNAGELDARDLITIGNRNEIPYNELIKSIHTNDHQASIRSTNGSNRLL